MKLKNLLKDISVKELHAETDLEISESVTIKSAETAACCAVRGFESDGHRYIPQRAEKGRSIVCEEAPEIDIPYVLVENSRLALA